MRIMGLIITAIAASAFSGAASAATVTFGDQEIDERSFADSVTLISGDFLVEGDASSPEEALAGSDGSTAGGCVVGSGECSFMVNFVDNIAVNDTGDDIILFARGGGYELFDITINGVTLAAQDATPTGYKSFRYDLMSFAFDLSVFGVATGESITSMIIKVGVLGTNPEDFIAFAALNSRFAEQRVANPGDNTLVTPLPAAGLLYLTGFGAFSGFAAARRKKKADAQTA